MTQAERRIYLIDALIKENPRHSGLEIPKNAEMQKKLLRSLFNVRMPKEVGDEFLKVQDEYLKAEIAEKGIVEMSDLEPVSDGIYLWQGDITRLACDAIVNAANSAMLGCFYPCHGCIDNAIHTFAGVQLRNECARIMGILGREEETGGAKITRGYNLPCKYVIHTVGPIISGPLTKHDEDLLSSCYRSCLEIADKNEVKSIAFCCISTGEFHFPNDRAAQIATRTVREYQKKSEIEVIFNVFKDIDRDIYRRLLGGN